MTAITTTGVHHLRLTVTDIHRSRAFYTELLGFGIAVDGTGDAGGRADGRDGDLLFGGVVLSAPGMLLGLRPVAPRDDRFDENRAGLDHLSFAVADRADLDRAVRLFDERGIPHGDITDLGPAFGICVLPFRDPDNTQLELSSPR